MSAHTIHTATATPQGTIERLRGMADVWPGDRAFRQSIIDALGRGLAAHGYRAIDTPVVEATELFLRKSGEERAAQMYAFDARQAAENVDEDRLHVLVARDDQQRIDHLVHVVGRGDVEEVRRLATRELDAVHRRHRQPGAVDEAADVTVELDEVVDALLVRLDLARILFVLVA